MAAPDALDSSSPSPLPSVPPPEPSPSPPDSSDLAVSGPVDPSLPSFKEESYFVSDLKEPEKKLLLEFKLRIEEALKNNEFVPPPPKPQTLKDVVDEAVKSEHATKEDAAAKDVQTEAANDVKSEHATKEDAAAAKDAETQTAKDAETQDAGTQTDEANKAEPECKEAFGEVKMDETVVAAIEDVIAPGTSEAIEDVIAPGTCEAVEVPKEVAAPAEAETVEATKEVLVEENTTPLEDISLWGVPVLHTKGDERTDVILLKFLRARDFKVNEAFAMLKNTVIWRKSFGVDKLVEEDFGTSLDGVAYMSGNDKQGHPVCYNVYGVFQDSDLYQEAFGDEAKIEKFLRWRVQLLERGIKQLDFSPGSAAALVQITDLKNAPGPARKELRLASKQALSLLQDNYPEFVAKKVFINVPWYFSAIYSMFSPFLTQRTKSKFVVARGGKVTEALFKLISPDNVPVQYGGLSRPNDSDFKDAEAKCTEFVVKSGAKQTIEIPVTEAGATVIWDLTVVGWNVTCGAEYIPSASDSYTTIIEKPKKMQATEQSIRNSFKAADVGKVVITIDNSSSRKKKVVAYRYLVNKVDDCLEIGC